MSKKWDDFYLRGKLRGVIYALAVGPEDIRKRIVQVYHGLFNLRKDQFPENLQSDWEWIKKELTKFGPILREDGSILRGAVENTCSKIKNKTGVKIAQKLVDMYESLEST